MIIDLGSAGSAERIYVPGPRLPILEMACDVLRGVMAHEGDGTVEVNDDKDAMSTSVTAGTTITQQLTGAASGVGAYQVNELAQMDEADALDRILTWMLDDEDVAAGLATILLKFKDQKPGDWPTMCEFLVGGVVAVRNGGIE